MNKRNRSILIQGDGLLGVSVYRITPKGGKSIDAYYQFVDHENEQSIILGRVVMAKLFSEIMSIETGKMVETTFFGDEG